MVARWCSLGALLLGGLLAAGCAIPTQQGPSIVPPSRVPRGLESANAPSTTTTQPRPSSEVPVKIYLLGPGNGLVGVNRVVLNPAPLTAVIAALLDGPSQTDSNEGFFTAIPNDVQVLSAVTKGSVVTVNFNGAFAGITGGNTELAVAQVVATVVLQSRPGTGVIFEIEGAPTSVPIASGVQVQGPVYLWQFLTTAA